MHKINFDLIAEKAGVSKGLVSRALNNKPNISEEKRDEIIRTANQLGYDFKHLRSKRKLRKCLLVITSSMLAKINYWEPIIRKITTTLDEKRIELEYFVFGLDENLKSVAKRLQSVQTAGYIFMSYNPKELLDVATVNKLPVVVIDPKYVHADKHLQIKFDNKATFYDLTKTLIDYGHKNILFYGPKNESTSFDERLEGYSLCIKENKGIKSYKALFNNKKGYYEDNYLLTQMLNKHPEITAIVCDNDIVALNCIRTIKSMGKKVPEDYSVVGFDNIEESKTSGIDLTTANVPREELGAEAANYLFKRINDQQVKYSQIVIYCEIIIRSSIRKLV